MLFTLSPIGIVSSTRKQTDDDDWDTVESHVELTADLSDDSLRELGSFSHAMIIFVMHDVDEADISTGARHPRDQIDLPEVGILAQRASVRPNRLGVTVCRIEKVEGRCVWLRGLDAIDGTPVIDIKPWVAEFGPRGKIFQPDWMTDLMKDYWRK